MASLRRKPNSRFWIACFTDQNGAQKDVRIARDDKDWVVIAERWAACPVNSQVRHRRTLYRNCHGLFLAEKTHGGCNCSRKHWHVLPLAEVQKLKQAAEKAKREEEKILRKENRLAFKRTMASGAFSLAQVRQFRQEAKNVSEGRCVRRRCAYEGAECAQTM